jgi:iron(III) transport system substrate-binding protein
MRTKKKFPIGVTPLVVLFSTIFLVSVASLSRAASLREQMIEKAKKEGSVVLSGSSADNLRDLLKGFRKSYPFLTIKAIPSNTRDTINRVLLENRAGKSSIDVVNVGDDGGETLAGRKISQKYTFPHLKDFAPNSQPSHGRYVAYMSFPRYQGMYNTQLVPRDRVPRTWKEMLDPKWKGKTLLSRSSEEIPANLAWLWREGDKLNWKRAFSFFEELFKNQQPSVARGYRGGANRVAAGEMDVFWFVAPGPPTRLALRGAPVGIIAFPKFHGGYRTFSIPRRAPHPAAAWLFVDYMTSPQGQFEYTEYVSAHFPLNKKAKIGKQTRWLTSQGASAENADIPPPDKISEIFTEDVLKKSENFYFKSLGLK